ncbi:carbonate dehydratase [Lentisphaera marina]|uniref:carbonate dehydratase n=1 Tax=Lentisphaera marina TaxID=1111041 RepID=UPI002366314A|nr:carbonate dehydratase [Lentisphaera marina]MDD7986469.1 carbonate dehydratase [Lentisphaera marina]
MSHLAKLLENNQNWAASITEENADFFTESAKGQSPEYLWIGCADSRVPANVVTSLGPGEMFVHRNIANVMVNTDLNSLSVLQYAVEVLKVKHIVVCGHYGCGGVKASMGEDQFGLIDNWLRHIKDVARLNESELEGLNEDEKFDRLCELNVKEQVINVASNNIVKNAWAAGQEVSVNGVIYDLKDGLLKDLEISIDNSDYKNNFE